MSDSKKKDDDVPGRTVYTMEYRGKIVPIVSMESIMMEYYERNRIACSEDDEEEDSKSTGDFDCDAILTAV